MHLPDLEVALTEKSPYGLLGNLVVELLKLIWVDPEFECSVEYLALELQVVFFVIFCFVLFCYVIINFKKYWEGRDF